METPVIRWTRLIRLDDEASGSSRAELALVVTPELARGIASLIKVSQEYRDVGLLVTSVGPNGQAATAGIERGDVLLRYDGVPLDTAKRLTSLAGVEAQGETPQVALEAVRGGQEMTFAVPAGRLGITVSALLDRSGSSHRTIRAMQDDEGTEAGELGQLVEVPRELAPQVLLLAEVLQRPGNAKQRKKTTALLATAAGNI